MQQIETNTKLKHPNKVLPTIFLTLHVKTRKVCFPIRRFVSMSSAYELMTNCCAIEEIIRKLLRERLALTSQFDVSKLQKYFKM